MPLPISEHASYLAHRAVPVAQIFDFEGGGGYLSLTYSFSVISENVIINHMQTKLYYFFELHFCRRQDVFNSTT